MHRTSVVQANQDVQVHRMHLDSVSTSLEDHLTGYFRKNGVTTTHHILPGPHGDMSRTIALQWDLTEELESPATITLQLMLRLLLNGSDRRFSVVATLSKQVNEKTKEASLDLPDIPADEHSEATLATQTEAAVATLATELSNTDNVAL